jgi:hypothetical protein
VPRPPSQTGVWCSVHLHNVVSTFTDRSLRLRPLPWLEIYDNVVYLSRYTDGWTLNRSKPQFKDKVQCLNNLNMVLVRKKLFYNGFSALTRADQNCHSKHSINHL